MRVLLATDGSEDAHTATAYLARFPRSAGSGLRVVSVASIPPSALDVPTVRDFHASLGEAARQAAEAARAALAPRFADADVQVLEGDAREAILRAAESGRPISSCSAPAGWARWRASWSAACRSG